VRVLHEWDYPLFDPMVKIVYGHITIFVHKLGPLYSDEHIDAVQDECKSMNRGEPSTTMSGENRCLV
jgi:hypothetical protein